MHAHALYFLCSVLHKCVWVYMCKLSRPVCTMATTASTGKFFQVTKLAVMLSLWQQLPVICHYKPYWMVWESLLTMKWDYQQWLLLLFHLISFLCCQSHDKNYGMELYHYYCHTEARMIHMESYMYMGILDSRLNAISPRFHISTSVHSAVCALLKTLSEYPKFSGDS